MNKTQKANKCREIIRNTSMVVDDESAKFLLEQIFPNHPEWEKKQGVGVERIEVRPDGHGGRCFYIIRLDGSFTDISFVASISSPKKKNDVIKACRSAIRPLIDKMRESIELPFVCPITGEVVYDKRDVHIDHYDMTFRQLFDEWVKGKDIEELYRMTLRLNKDNDTNTYFDNEEICNDFIEFHNKHTHLRAVSKRANLSELRKI